MRLQYTRAKYFVCGSTDTDNDYILSRFTLICFIADLFIISFLAANDEIKIKLGPELY